LKFSHCCLLSTNPRTKLASLGHGLVDLLEDDVDVVVTREAAVLAVDAVVGEAQLVAASRACWSAGGRVDPGAL